MPTSLHPSLPYGAVTLVLMTSTRVTLTLANNTQAEFLTLLLVILAQVTSILVRSFQTTLIAMALSLLTVLLLTLTFVTTVLVSLPHNDTFSSDDCIIEQVAQNKSSLLLMIIFKIHKRYNYLQGN
jgi:hypothetical protein